MGGHDIPEADIRRRFPRSLDYLERVYKPLVDAWWVWSSGESGLELVDLVSAMKASPQTQLIEEALREAAWKARHGTRDERAGKFLGKQAAVEKAVASVRDKKPAARG
jgi:hypothetical protein